MPVMALPRTRACTSCVPSYVFTDSKLTTWRMMWYSSWMPLPPSMSRHARAICSALPHELRLTRETISGAKACRSLARPTARLAWKPTPISVTASASFRWMSCWAARGAPNCLRPRVYSRACSTHASAAPRAPHEMPYRAELRQANGPPRPRAWGNIADSGTRTSSSRMEPVIEARSDSLPTMGGVERAAGCDASTALRSIRKPRTPPLSTSARAHTSSTSAMGEFVIQVLLPLSRHSRASASHLARVVMPDGSEPCSGSVRPKQPIASPVARLGSHRCFCSSEPKREIGCITSDDWTDIAERYPLSTCSTARAHSPYAT
mmetsp:Transcript_8791/g.17715  ORF Transcript_8791/g.17715 Transcript_8791/m.17715 type:complete len:320 (-) Transcript_8791:388-1347(-)